MNILHIILLSPFFVFGCIVGYFSRSFIRGWYSGFYYVEYHERNKLTNQLKEIINENEI